MDERKEFYKEADSKISEILESAEFKDIYEIFHSDVDAGLTAFKFKDPKLNCAKHGEFSYFMAEEDFLPHKVELFIGAQTEETEEDNEYIAEWPLDEEAVDRIKSWLFSYAEEPAMLDYDTTAPFFQALEKEKEE